MLRNESLEEIWDGKLYTLNDMVKADCRGCNGCSECCRGMDDTVVLDPLDVHRICTYFKMEPEELIASRLEIGFVDGLILPHLAMTGPDKACSFLNAKGRCSIHPYRPGFCRMFPLGRYYQGDDFSYILQVHECPKPDRTKVKVKKWLDTPDLRQYEKFVRDWHNFLRDVRLLLSDSEDETLFDNMNRYIIGRFYRQPYDPDKDFYVQFEARLVEGKNLLAL